MKYDGGFSSAICSLPQENCKEWFEVNVGCWEDYFVIAVATVHGCNLEIHRV
jgi:hypothetical protein